jgi:hypothetical protein
MMIRGIDLRAGLRAQASKRYWHVFLGGLAAYVVSVRLSSSDPNEHLVPLVTLLASALVLWSTSWPRHRLYGTH